MQKHAACPQPRGKCQRKPWGTTSHSLRPIQQKIWTSVDREVKKRSSSKLPAGTAGDMVTVAKSSNPRTQEILKKNKGIHLHRKCTSWWLDKPKVTQAYCGKVAIGKEEAPICTSVADAEGKDSRPERPAIPFLWTVHNRSTHSVPGAQAQNKTWLPMDTEFLLREKAFVEWSWLPKWDTCFLLGSWLIKMEIMDSPAYHTSKSTFTHLIPPS